MHNTLLMIKNLSLKNFKGISEKVTIKLSNITLLFGLNNVGKSSIVQSLDLFTNLSDKFELPIVTDYKNYGSIKSIVNNRQFKKPALIELEFDSNSSPNKIEYLFSDLSSEISFYDYELGDYIFEKSIEFSRNGFAFINKINTEKKSYMQLESATLALIKKNKSIFIDIFDVIKNFRFLKYHEYILRKIVSKNDSYMSIDDPTDKIIIDKIFDNLNLVVNDFATEFVEKNKSDLIQESSLHFDVIYISTFEKFISNNKNLVIKTIDKYYKNLNIEDSSTFNYIVQLLRSKIYENLYVKPLQFKEFELHPRLRQRFRRFSNFEIQSDLEMKEVRLNLDNILNFCSLVINKDTKSRDNKIKKLIYQNILEYKSDSL